MLAQHQRFLGGILCAIDFALLTAGAFVGAAELPDPAPRSQLYLFLGLLLLSWWLLAFRLDVYHSRRSEPIRFELKVLLEAVVSAMGMSCLVTLAAHGTVPVSVGYTFLAAASGLLLSRALIRGGLRLWRSSGHNTRNALFAGQGETARRLVASLRRHPSLGIRSVGYITLGGEDPQLDEEGLRRVGGIEDLKHVLAQHRVDEVIICPSRSTTTGQIQHILADCEVHGVPCRVAPESLSPHMPRWAVGWVDNTPTYTFTSGQIDSFRLGIKRELDVVGSILGLVLLAPVLIACAIAVRRSGPGPILFRQARCGLRGKRFTLYKFRTMRVGAEGHLGELLARNEREGPVFKLRNDPRVTRVGRFLRRYSLDELPQLLNVLVGDMSLVGPRPPIPEEVEKYQWWQRKRLSVKPGLTCLWQVSRRNDASFEKWMEADMNYIDQWSLTLDLKVMLKTVGAVFRGTGV
jgi:exopolysaccharide biosynthesis polyprenyl glycosylphosphotransferase